MRSLWLFHIESTIGQLGDTAARIEKPRVIGATV
jgi:hypothetical protein